MKSGVHKITVIIPHYNGEAILRRCLLSITKTQYPDFSVVVVDNASNDSSNLMVRKEFPNVRIIRSDINLGYAGGCNYGILHTESPYIVLLNNDAVVTPGWIDPLIEFIENRPDVAAVQPKTLSIKDPARFDYCGAAGGEMDIFGYPFARGRLFDVMEQDTGQYDDMKDIFWVTGAAMLVRRTALDTVGLFETAFFAHMEEIDLCWRFHLAGYRICVIPQSVVYHQTGGTLGQGRLKKMVLNHRNNLLMILRNYSLHTLTWLFPIRLLFEFATIFSSLFIGQWKRVFAVPVGICGVLRHLKTIHRGRKVVKRIRKTTDRDIMKSLYPRSVAFEFFIAGKKRYQDLMR